MASEMNTPLNRKERIDRLVSNIQVIPDCEDDFENELVFDGHERDDDANVFTVLFSDIADQVGLDFLEQIPTDLLEQFCMMTVTRNESTGLLIRNLLLGFMQAYADPITSDEAVSALLDLEDLGGIPKATIN